jgi:hypothetical protein
MQYDPGIRRYILQILVSAFFNLVRVILSQAHFSIDTIFQNYVNMMARSLVTKKRAYNW